MRKQRILLITLTLCMLFTLGAADAEKVQTPPVNEKGAEKATEKASSDQPQDKATDVKEKADPVEQTTSPGIARGGWDTCLPEKAVVQDLEKRERDLAAKDKELKNRELDLKNRETAINEELRKLDQLRKDIQGLKAQRRQKNEEQVTKLIETIEKMSPKSAAPLLAKVDEDLAVATMQGLSTEKLSKIMSNMDLQRSIRLSELLAMGENAPARESGKGGESGSNR